MIDTDEVTYTIPMLKQWRTLAELRARLRQAHGDIDFTYHSDFVAAGLAPGAITLNPAPEANHVISEKIGLAICHAWLPEICGKESADAVRDFLIEHARNAFSHGGATSVEVTFTSNSIEVSDDGAPFAIANLAAPNTRGGGLAYRALLNSKHLGRASSQRAGDKNQVHIPFVLNAADLARVNPCAVALDHSDIRAGTLNFAQFAGCDRIFLVAPNYAVYSDAGMYQRALKQFLAQHQNVVLIFPHASLEVIKHYAEQFPTAKMETW